MNFFKIGQSSKTDQQITLKKRSLITRIGRDPHVDWVFMVVFSFILTATLVFISLLRYFYFDSALKEEIPVEKINVSKTINEKTLNEVLDRYDKRAKIRADLHNGYFGPGDPSI